MRISHILRAGLTAVFAAALTLSVALPANAAPPKHTKTMVVTNNLACLTVKTAAALAQCVAAPPGPAPLAPAPKPRSSATPKSAAAAAAADGTDLLSECREVPGYWWILRDDACITKDVVVIFLDNGVPRGAAAYAVTFALTPEYNSLAYDVSATVEPLETLAAPAGATYELSGFCEGSCRLGSDSPMPTHPAAEPSVNEWAMDALIYSPLSMVNAGAEIDMNFTAPGYTVGRVVESMEQVRCDNVQVYTGCVFAEGWAIMTYSLTGPYPQIAQHIASAQAAGKTGGIGTNGLHRVTDPKRIDSNRYYSCLGFTPNPGQECDEYPFASSAEGGAGASRASVDPGQNAGAGSALRWDLYEKQHVLADDPYFVNIVAGPAGPWFAPVRGGESGGGGGAGAGGRSGGSTDLNGDGVADLLTQGPNGDLYAYPGSGGIVSTVTSSTFGAGTDIGSWAGHVNFALGDINGDGRPDLLSQLANGDMYAYPGRGSINGTTTFWSGTKIGNWAGHANFVLGDLNGDGKADLLTQYYNGNLYVYPGSGSINTSTTFWSGTMIGSWAGHVNFALGDLNGDHRPDLLSQTADGNMYAYPGSGRINATTTFWSGTMIGNWAGHTNYDLADLNGDGHPDLLSRTAGGTYYAYRGSGSINASTTFWSGIQLDTTDVYNYAMADLSGDGRPDLLTQDAYGELRVYPGSGQILATQTSNTTFWSGTDVGNWSGHTNLVRGDLNGDGIDDLLTQTANGDLYVYRGSGSINATTTFWSGVMIGNWAGHSNLALGDLDGDGKADLLTQTANGDVYVYRGSGAINSTTTFWSGVMIGNWAGHDHLVLGDLNGDGKADLLTQYYNGNLYAYPGSGSINASTTFWSGTMIGSWAGHIDLALGDLNGDHIADLVSQTANGDLYAYPGSGSINATTTFWSGTRVGSWAGHTNITL